MEKIRYSDLLPGEFRERLAAKPGAYLPLGTLAWHGEHLPLGSDAMQSEVLQGMDYADSTDPHRQLDRSSFIRTGISCRIGWLTIRNTASLYSIYCKL